MPLQIAAHLDKILLYLSLTYCMHLLIKAARLILSGNLNLRSLADWSQPLDLRQRSASNAAPVTASHRPTAIHPSPNTSALQHPPIPPPPKASATRPPSEPSESAAPHSEPTGAQPPWLRALSAADERWDDSGQDKTDTALVRQAFCAMVRRRRNGCREWLRERLAEGGEGPRLRPPPPRPSFSFSFSFFGLRWPSSV
jgi:hypothetical protein